MEPSLVPALKTFMQIDLPENISFEQLKERLADYINELIQSDFNKLVSLLYRVDVSESRLKYLLQHSGGEETGKIIAELIIERQIQKLKSREEQRRDSLSSDEETW